MNQVFSADAVQNNTSQPLTNGTPLQVLLGNAIAIALGQAQPVWGFKVSGTINATLGTTATSLRAQIFRNPSTDNVLVADSGIITSGIGAGLLTTLSISGVDTITDGRDVQYGIIVTVQGTGSTSVTHAFLEAQVLE